MALPRAENPVITTDDSSLFLSARIHFSSDNPSARTLVFASEPEAMNHFAWIKQHLTADPSISSLAIKEVPAPADPLKKTYHICLTENQWKKLRENYRNTLPKTHLPKTDFIVKTIRADEFCYYKQYLEMVVLGKKYPPRSSSKRDYTVMPNGIFLRKPDPTSNLSVKTPLYTTEQKKGFSTPQPASYGIPAYHTSIFTGFTPNSVAGVFLESKDILLSNQNYISDFSSGSRPYDFYSLAAAEWYLKNVCFFSSKNMESFKNAIQEPKNKNNYNEVLARQRWNRDGTSKNFIGKDTLESRLVAKEYARMTRTFLLTEKLVKADYHVPVFFYCPDVPELHGKEYTNIEYAMDCVDAQFIFSDAELCRTKYLKLEYQFLFTLRPDQIRDALRPDQIRDALASEVRFVTLGWHLLGNGYMYILESLANRLDLPPQDLINEVINDAEKQVPGVLGWVYFHLVRCHYNQAAQRIISDDNKKNNEFCNLTDTSGRTILIVAVECRSLELVDHLLTHLSAVDINLQDNRKRSALSIAIWNQHESIVLRLLQEKNINVNYLMQNGEHPLCFAAKRGNTVIVRALLNKELSGISDEVKDTALFIANQLGHKDTARLLFQKGGWNQEVIYKAILSGQQDADIEAIVTAHPARINTLFPYADETLLNYAATHGRSELVKFLIEQGADCNKPKRGGITPLFSAIDSASNSAINSGCLKSARYLILAKNININLATTRGETPLHLAAYRGYEDIVDLLLEKKAEVSRKMDEDVSFLRTEAQRANFENEFDELLKTHNIIKWTPVAGWSVLHGAIFFRRHSIVLKLLKNGALLNSTGHGINLIELAHLVNSKRATLFEFNRLNILVFSLIKFHYEPTLIQFCDEQTDPQKKAIFPTLQKDIRQIIIDVYSGYVMNNRSSQDIIENIINPRIETMRLVLDKVMSPENNLLRRGVFNPVAPDIIAKLTTVQDVAALFKNSLMEWNAVPSKGELEVLIDKLLEISTLIPTSTSTSIPTSTSSTSSTSTSIPTSTSSTSSTTTSTSSTSSTSSKSVFRN